MTSTCLLYGIGDHDCAEHPGSPSVIPEPCTTWSYRLRHLSVDLAPRRIGRGRDGHPLCDDTDAYDQLAADAIVASWSGKRPKRIADLPACKKCAKKAEKAGVAP